VEKQVLFAYKGSELEITDLSLTSERFQAFVFEEHWNTQHGGERPDHRCNEKGRGHGTQKESVLAHRAAKVIDLLFKDAKLWPDRSQSRL
jgi:hypothetical protein